MRFVSLKAENSHQTTHISGLEYVRHLIAIINYSSFLERNEYQMILEIYKKHP